MITVLRWNLCDAAAAECIVGCSLHCSLMKPVLLLPPQSRDRGHWQQEPPQVCPSRTRTWWGRLPWRSLLAAAEVSAPPVDAALAATVAAAVTAKITIRSNRVDGTHRRRGRRRGRPPLTLRTLTSMSSEGQPALKTQRGVGGERRSRGVGNLIGMCPLGGGVYQAEGGATWAWS